MMKQPFLYMIAGHLAVSLEIRYREIERLKDLAVFLKSQELLQEEKLASLTKEKELGTKTRQEYERAQMDFLRLRQKVDEWRDKADAVREKLNAAGNPFFYSIKSYFSPYANPPLDQLKARYTKHTRRTREAEEKMDDARQAYLIAKDAFEATQGLADSVVFAARSTASDYSAAMESMVAIHQEIDKLIHESILNTPVLLFFNGSKQFHNFPGLLETVLHLKRMLVFRTYLSTYVVPVQPDNADTRFLCTGKDVTLSIDSAFQERKSKLKGKVMFIGQGTAHKKTTSRTGNHTRTHWKKIDVSLDGPVSMSHNWGYRLWDQQPFTASLAVSAHNHYMAGMKSVIEEERLSSIQGIDREIAQLTATIRKTWEKVAPKSAELRAEP